MKVKQGLTKEQEKAELEAFLWSLAEKGYSYIVSIMREDGLQAAIERAIDNDFGCVGWRERERERERADHAAEIERMSAMATKLAADVKALHRERLKLLDDLEQSGKIAKRAFEAAEYARGASAGRFQAAAFGSV